jgi:hypothetical protein
MTPKLNPKHTIEKALKGVKRRFKRERLVMVPSPFGPVGAHPVNAGVLRAVELLVGAKKGSVKPDHLFFKRVPKLIDFHPDFEGEGSKILRKLVSEYRRESGRPDLTGSGMSEEAVTRLVVYVENSLAASQRLQQKFNKIQQGKGAAEDKEIMRMMRNLRKELAGMDVEALSRA